MKKPFAKTTQNTALLSRSALFSFLAILAFSGIVCAYTPGEYLENPDALELFNSSGAYTTSYAAGSSITINVTTQADLNESGTSRNEFTINNYLGNTVSTCAEPCFTQTGSGPVFTYTRTFTLPATSDWYYLRIRVEDNSGSPQATYEGRAEIIVGNPATPHYIKYFKDSSYTTEMRFFKPGSHAYIAMYGDAGTADTGQSSITMFDFQNNNQNPTLNSASTSGTNQHRMDVTISPLITEDWWYPFEPRYRTSGGTTLARARGSIIGIDASPPGITIESPLNTTYEQTDLWFNITATESMTQTEWCGYSVNGGSNVTLSNDTATHYYNYSFVGGENSYNVTYYCNDSVGNYKASTEYFTINFPPTYTAWGLTVPDGTGVFREDSLVAYALWDEAIDTAFVSHNGTGAQSNYTISPPHTGNWTNHTFDLTDGSSFAYTGLVNVTGIHANDTFGAFNHTEPYHYFYLWGYSKIAQIDLVPDMIENFTSTTISCKVTDNETNAGIEGYNVSFYDNVTGYLGSNTTVGGGWAFWNYTDATPDAPKYVNISCNISGNSSKYYNSSLENQTSSELYIYPPGDDPVPPEISYVSIINADASKIGLGQNITIYSDVTDNKNLSSVYVYITSPDSVTKSYKMYNNSWEYYYIPWKNGQYSYYIWANDSSGNNQTNGTFTFNVSSNATLNIATLNDSYRANQMVNITGGALYNSTPSIADPPPSSSIKNPDYAYELEWEPSIDPLQADSTATTSANSLAILTDNADNTRTDVRYDLTRSPQRVIVLVSDYTGEPFKYENITAIIRMQSGSGTTQNYNISIHGYKNSNEPNVSSYYNAGSFAISGAQTNYSFDITNVLHDAGYGNMRFRLITWTNTNPTPPSRIRVAEVRYNLTEDKKMPAWSGLSQNETYVSKNSNVGIASYWSDNVQMKNATLYTNKTGTWAVEETKSISGKNTWANFTIETAGIRQGTTVAWYINGTDYNGNTNRTQTLSFIIEKSFILNRGDTNISGYLLMNVQYKNGSDWQLVDTVINDTNTSTIRTINASEILDLDKIWNPISWNTSNLVAGTYRSWAALTNSTGGTLVGSDSVAFVDAYEFKITYIDNITAQPDPISYGTEVEIKADVENPNGVSSVYANVTCPCGKSYFIMLSKQGATNTYKANFTETWRKGTYNYYIWSNDTDNNIDTSDMHTFDLVSYLSINGAPALSEYGAQEDVNLVFKDYYSSAAPSVGPFTPQYPTIDPDEGWRYRWETTGYSLNFPDSQNWQILNELTDVTDNQDSTWSWVESDFNNNPQDIDGFVSELHDAKTKYVSIVIRARMRKSGGGTTDEVIRVYTYLADGNAINTTDYISATYSFSQTPANYDFNITSLIQNSPYPYIRTRLVAGEHNSGFYFYLTEAEYLLITETVPPKSSGFRVSPQNPNEGSSVQVYADWEDNSELHYAWLETNATGTWANSSYTALGNSSSASANITFSTAGIPKGTLVAVRMYANDTVGNYNATDTKSFIVENSDLRNSGTLTAKGYFLLRIQKNSTGTWQNYGFPVVDDTIGPTLRTINPESSFDISSVWNPAGWDTNGHNPGWYRVYLTLVDSSQTVLEGFDSTSLIAYYPFRIVEANMKLSSISHENSYSAGVNEYETGDTIGWVNATSIAYNSTALNANITLNVLDSLQMAAGWGPYEQVTCGTGTVQKDSSCISRFDNSTYGYIVPEEATFSDTETFYWNATMKLSNGPTVNNKSLTFKVHNMLYSFSSTLSPQKIIRGSYTIYTFNFSNPWTKNITDINVSLNYNAIAGISANCTLAGQTSQDYCLLYNVTAGSWKNATFNVSTISTTPVADYDINATVTYTNPGSETHTKSQIENQILQVRLPGMDTTINNYATPVTRGNAYNYNASVNNTAASTQDNVWLNWTLPSGWSNSSGNLYIYNATLAPESVLWNNITADISLSSKLGLQQVRIDSESDGYFDWDTKFIAVYANTYIVPSASSANPAQTDTIYIYAVLHYDNGSVISGANINFTDITDSVPLGLHVTDGTGKATATYAIPAGSSLGIHTINISYSGSTTKYRNPSSNMTNITVHDKPKINSANSTPSLIGYGMNTTLYANVTDPYDGVSLVQAKITKPDTSSTYHTMSNISDIYFVNYSSWTKGQYSFEIIATDNAGKTNQSAKYYFSVGANARVNVATVSDTYYPDEYVYLTDGNRTVESAPDTSTGASPYIYTNASDAWQYQWDSTSQTLPDSQYSALNNRLSIWSDSSTAGGSFDEIRNNPGGTDIRSLVSQYNANPKKYDSIILSLQIDKGNGGSTAFGFRIYGYLADGDTLNTSAHINQTETITRLNWDWFNFTITDIMKSAGYTSMRLRVIVTNNTQTLGDEPDVAEVRYYLRLENASPQYLNYGESSMNPGKGEAVTAYAYWTDNAELDWAWLEVNNGTGWTNKTYTNLNLSSGKWSNFTIQTTGLTHGTNVSYRIWANDSAGNINVTGKRGFVIEKSEIVNNGPDMFGYLLMKIQTNNSGSWVDVETVIDDVSTSTKRFINSTSAGWLELDKLWNPVSWFTDKLQSGWYRVYAAVRSPTGTILTNSDNSQLTDTYAFQLKPPKSNLDINNIKIYDVTGKSQTHTDTTVLEGEGLNKTHNLYINRTYRAEVYVRNLPSSEEPWTISSEELLKHDYLNSSWAFNASADIWYSNGTDFTGGTWSSGSVIWNTSLGGTLPVGSTAKFMYVFNITDNTNGTYSVRFLLNNTKITKQDYSTYYVREFDNTTPYIVGGTYNLTKTLVNRGESLVGFGMWNKNIAFGYAEYNRTTSALQNTTISTISGTWTNHTITTASTWKLGSHAFKFYVNDTFGNWNTTLPYLYFDVWGLASVSSSSITTPVVQGGNVTMRCRVTSDNSSALPNYNVTFYTSEKGYLGWNTTNTTGWASYKFTDSTLNWESATCNITDDAPKLHNASATNTSTRQFFTGELDPPKYSNVSVTPLSLYKGEQLDISAYWTDDNQLDYAWLETNETGSMQNSSLASQIYLGGTGNWSNFSVTVPLSSKRGPWQWRIWADDTSGNLNNTGINSSVTVWGKSAVNIAYLVPSKIYNGTASQMSCQIIDFDTADEIEGYTVSFYNETGLLGTNTTNSTGWAIFNFTDNSPTQPAQYNVTCNITDSLSLYYNASIENGKKKILTVINYTEDIIAPHLYNNIYGMSDTSLFKGENAVLYALWDEELTESYASYNSTTSSLSGYLVPTPYTGNWTNYTISTGSSWLVGIHKAKLNASDTMPHPNWNDTLPYLDFTVYGYAKISWLYPSGSMDRGTITLQCLVRDNMSNAPIAGHTVTFSNSTDNFLPTKTTNASGIATYTLDTTSYPTGNNQFFCTIGDKPSIYYYKDLSNYQASQTLTFTGALSVTITTPANASSANKGQSIAMESVTRDENNNPVTPDTANWYNATSNIGTAENITYTIPSGSILGPRMFKVNVTKTGYDTAENNVTIYVWGYSNISWQSPAPWSEYGQGSTIPLVCNVLDNYTGSGIENHKVSFYVYNESRTWYLGDSTTSATGNATYNWFAASSTYDAGIYYPKCNITDNSTLYYNTSSSFESNTTINITETEITGAFEVTLVIPPALATTEVARYRNLTVNATVRCINGPCGTVNGTAQYSNASTPYTNVPEGSGTPFHINDGSLNPKTCGNMNQNDECNLSWVLNVTGSFDTLWNISVLFEGTASEDNRTQNATISIKYLLILTVTPDELRLWHDPPENPADNYPAGTTNEIEPNTTGARSSEAVTVSLSGSSSDANGGVWLMGTNLTSIIASDWYIGPTNISICSGNLTNYPTPNSANACLTDPSKNLNGYYAQFHSSLNSGNSTQFVFFLDMPKGLAGWLGGYSGTVWVKVNGTA